MDFKTFSRDTHVIPIESVVIDRERRQRKQFQVEDLKPSIEKRGLQTPILVTREGHKLVAGERRITACKELGWTEIICRYVEELNPIELQIIEWEENFKRQELTWQDQVVAIATIHELYRTIDPEWTGAETAAQIGLSQAAVSKHIRLYQEMQEDNDRLVGASSSEQAYNLLSRKDHRANARALEELIGADPARQAEAQPQESVTPPETSEINAPVNPAIGPNDLLIPARSVIIVPPKPQFQTDPKNPSKLLTDVWHGSFLDWAPDYRGPKFNLIHCDFPYGANLFKGEFGKRGSDIEYEDTRDVFFVLLESFCDNLENFTSLSAHFMFWFSFEFYEPIKAMFRNKCPSIEWVRDPLIWGKSDNAGIIRDPRKHPRHIYEACLFGYRGNRNIITSVGDFYAAPTDRKLHPSAKPEPMLRNFFTMLVDEHTELLDPTCGAGSSLRAADSLGAKRVFGIELDPEHASIAQTTLNNSRRLRSAAKTVESN